MLSMLRPARLKPGAIPEEIADPGGVPRSAGSRAAICGRARIFWDDSLGLPWNAEGFGV